MEQTLTPNAISGAIIILIKDKVVAYTVSLRHSITIVD